MNTVKHILAVIINRYKSNLLLYFLIVIEIAIVISFMTLALNYQMFKEAEKEKSKVNDAKCVLHIETSGQDDSLLVLDQDDVLFLRQQFGQSLDCKIGYSNFFVDGEDPREYYSIYSNNVPENSVFAGEKIRRFVESEEKNEEEKLKICPIPDDFDLYLPESYIEAPVDKDYCVLYPLESYTGYETDPMAFSSICVTLSDTTGDNMEETLRYLHSKYSDNGVYYYYSNEEFRQNYMIEYLSMIPGYFGKTAAVLMLVMLTGFIGIMKTLLFNRKKELAISYACGARRSQLSFELLGEITGVCLAGALTGISIGVWLTLKIDFGLPVTVYGRTVLYIILMISLMVTSVYAPVLRGLRKSSIYEAMTALRKE